MRTPAVIERCGASGASSFSIDRCGDCIETSETVLRSAHRSESFRWNSPGVKFTVDAVGASRRSLTAFVILVLLSVLMTGKPLAAQAPASPTGQRAPSADIGAAAPSVPSQPSRAASEGDRRLRGRIKLETESGDLIPLEEVLGESYQNALEELYARSTEQLNVPAWEIRRLDLDGVVERDVVRLNAEIRIQVHRRAEWVLVPLSFGELHLIDGYEHQSEAKDAAEIPETSDTSQKRWRLFGAGEHILRLKLIGRTRTQPPSSHLLAMSLPAGTISHAQIRFAAPVDLQRLPVGTVSRAVPAESGPGTQEVEFWGLDNGLQLVWADIVARVNQKPLIHSDSRMKLQLTTIPAAVSVTQKLEITGAPVSEVHIVIPPGFRRLETRARNASGPLPITIADGSAVSEAAEAPESPPQGVNVSAAETEKIAGTSDKSNADTTDAGASTRIRFPSPQEGLVTIDYDLELMQRSFPQDIRIRLPLVPEASVQTGDVDVAVPPGLLVRSIQPSGARQRRVTSETDSETAALAFQLNSEKSSVSLHVEEFEAQFAVSPEMEFQPEGDNVLLTARFSVNVLRGSLLDLRVHWPGYTGGLWQLFPGPISLVSDKSTTPLVPEFSGDELRLTFPDRQSGQFRIEMKAFAPREAVGKKETVLLCPEIVGGSQQPIVISTVESDQYSIQPISAEDGQLLPGVPAQSATANGSAPEVRRIQAWIHESSDRPLRLEFTEQAPSVTASIRAGFRPAETGIRVHEEIRFQIEHSDLSTISFIVPAGILPEVRITGSTETLRPSVESSTRISYHLAVVRRGELNLEVDYLWPVAAAEQPRAGESVRLNVPLIQPQSSVVTRCETGTSMTSGLAVQTEQATSGDDWSPVYSDSFEAAWAVNGFRDQIPIRWERSLTLQASEAPVFLMTRTVLIAGGSVTSTTAFFEKRPPRVTFQIPNGVSPKSDLEIVLDGQVVREGIFQTADAVTGTGTGNSNSNSTGGLRLSLATSAVGSAERRETRPQVSADDQQMVLELRVRQRFSRGSPLYQPLVFARPIFEQNLAAVPGIWFIEGPSDSRFLNSGAHQTAVSAEENLPLHIGRYFGLNDDSRIPDLQLRSFLSLYSESLQREVRNRMNEWQSGESHQRMFLVMSDRSELTVMRLTTMTLLLCSATACVFGFALFSVVRRGTVSVPVMILAVLMTAAGLFEPEWTTLLIPYILTGLMFSGVILLVQRLTTRQKAPFPGLAGNDDMLTVFGVSGFLAGSAPADE